ncbi:nucleoside recognition protein [Halopenitus persicus]|uniref:nucleoside recognition protein n=1 Tax=Halopenitus persicus TaxID=1048396 RepID=UPI001E326C21|nr:nucleoside recognition protein [Halopenitus persicus]
MFGAATIDPALWTVHQSMVELPRTVLALQASLGAQIPPTSAIVAGTVALLREVLPRLARITVFIALGVFIANLVVSFGLIRYIAGVAGYLTRPANLPDEVGTAILTTAASTTAGYATLAEYRESGLLDDRATIVAVMINTFFGFVQHVFTYYVPVLIPILGFHTGVLYVSIRAGISMAITIAGVVIGGLVLSSRNVDRSALADLETGHEGDATGNDASGAADDSSDSPRDRAREAAGKTAGTLRRIVPRLAVVYTLVIALITHVDVEALTGVAEPLTAALGLPGASVAIVAVYSLDTTAGAVAIAPLIGETFTPRTAVITMLLGGIVSFAVSTFKRSIPFQFGIWGPEFGAKVIAVNTAMKLVFITVAVAGLLLAP